MTTPVRDILGQPRGLAWLAGTQFWEAFSLYGMQALLTLYMVAQLLMPGHAENVVGLAATRAAIESITGPLSTQAFAVQLFGLWAGLVRFTPVFGGLLGDRLLGRRRTIMLGCVLMTLGHFCMAFDGSFLAALFLLMLGTGCANSNLFSQVGALYPPEDRRRPGRGRKRVLRQAGHPGRPDETHRLGDRSRPSFRAQPDLFRPGPAPSRRPELSRPRTTGRPRRQASMITT